MASEHVTQPDPLLTRLRRAKGPDRCPICDAWSCSCAKEEPNMKIPTHAVDAAIDSLYPGWPQWRDVADIRIAQERMMERAITAALTAIGASVVEWRRPEEFVQTPNDPL